MKKILLAFVVLVVAAVAAGQYWLTRAMATAGPNVDTVRVVIPQGASVRVALGALVRAGALSDARPIELYLRFLSNAPRIKNGTYDIAAAATPRAILAQLAAGRVVLESLTVIEGWTFAELRAAVAANTKIRHSLRLSQSDEELMAAIGHAGLAAEGQFFPDTYRFAEGSGDVEILKLAFDRMQSELAAAWAQRAPDLPLRNVHELLVLASVVEKETGLARERPQIAGVFIERLRRNMRLQSDPTVIYGLGARYDGDIRDNDLTTDTPYNTYTRGGLPPTPIALVSRASLQAVTHPAQDGAIFFTARGNGDGSSVFTKTYAEHQLAVKKMLQEQRASARRPTLR